MTVLRDPPGSNSYSYLEKGLTFNSTSSYVGTIANTGEEGTTIGASNAVYSWHGVGSGVMNVAIEADNGTTIGVKHEESYTGTNKHLFYALYFSQRTQKMQIFFMPPRMNSEPGSNIVTNCMKVGFWTTRLTFTTALYPI